MVSHSRLPLPRWAHLSFRGVRISIPWLMFAKIELDGGPALDLGDAPRREEAFQIGGALLSLFGTGKAENSPRASAQPKL